MLSASQVAREAALARRQVVLLPTLSARIGPRMEPGTCTLAQDSGHSGLQDSVNSKSVFILLFDRPRRCLGLVIIFVEALKWSKI